MSAINRNIGMFVDDDGAVFPVTNWLDEEGDDCDPSDAVAAVAGAGGRWYTLQLSEFDGSVH